MRPGAMHTLSLCLGSIGTIMKGLGLEEYIQAAYQGIPHMSMERTGHVLLGDSTWCLLVWFSMFDALQPDDTDKFEEAMTSTL